MTTSDRLDPDAIRHTLRHDYHSGWALTAEFLSAIGLWTLVGWLGDRWLGTAPWLLLAGTTLGFVLGMVLMWYRHQLATEADRERFQYRDRPRSTPPDTADTAETTTDREPGTTSDLPPATP